MSFTIGGRGCNFTGRGVISFTATPSQTYYAFTTFTFSNAGATGNTGPTYAQVKSAYSATAWTQNQSYLDVQTQGYQLWTVPASGNYTIECAGASGGLPSASNGLGNIISSTFTFTAGQKLQIIVGQQGGTGTSSGRGGGGGSFDAVGHHPYSYPYDPSGGQSWNAFTQTGYLYQIMVANGDGAKKVWGTESGAPTGNDPRAPICR